jgi:hypothetical protein
VILHEERNYLFVHIQKTGGTSITMHLSEHFGTRFISPAHLQLRYLSFSGPKPFIFAAIRNPWERLVSWYEMMLAKGIHNDFSRYLLEPDAGALTPCFSDFIRRTAVIRESATPERLWSGGKGLIYDEQQGYLKSLSFNQIDYLTDSLGQVIYDRIINFSKLADGFSAVMEELHPGEKLPELIRLNARPMPRDWRSYYQSGDDRDWVARLYRRDIDHFGFDFVT